MATRMRNWVRCEWHIGGWSYWFTQKIDFQYGCKHPARYICFTEITEGDPILICGIHLKFLKLNGLAERWRSIPELREKDRTNWWLVMPPPGITWETPDILTTV